MQDMCSGELESDEGYTVRCVCYAHMLLKLVQLPSEALPSPLALRVASTPLAREDLVNHLQPSACNVESEEDTGRFVCHWCFHYAQKCLTRRSSSSSMPLDDIKDHLRTSVADRSSPSSNPSESESSFERQDENVANVQSLAPINHSDSDPDEVTQTWQHCGSIL